MRALRRGGVWGCLLFACIAPGIASAQVVRVELHVFQSTTLTDEQFLAGRTDGKPVDVAGELRIPRSGSGRVPAVVLVHGSGGVTGAVDDWAKFLNSLGIATFVFDAFTPRGIVNTIDDQDQLGRLAMMVDAFRALGLLARHPRVDPQRIAVMGFSRGGQSALYASVRRFQRMHAPPDASFAAYVALYPSCNMTFLQDGDVVDRPIRIFHGAADDWVPVAPCRGYVERLRKAGKDVKLTEFPGARHIFDWASLKNPLPLPKAQSARRCAVEEVALGKLVNAETRQPFTFEDPCVERGVTIAYDAQAAADTRAAVQELFASVLLGR